MDRAGRALRRQIPQRAIERVARRARRHGGLQRRAVEAVRDIGAHRLDRRRNGVDGLAVARIRHAFAAAAMRPVEQFGYHDHRLGLGTAADRKEPAIGQRSMRTESEVGACGFMGRRR